MTPLRFLAFDRETTPVARLFAKSGLRFVPVAKPSAPGPRKVRRPGEALTAELESTERGQRLISAARQEVGAMLHECGVAPLAALRMEAGLSQSALAKLAKMKQPQLSRLENGRHKSVRSDTIKRLALALNVPELRVYEAIDQTGKRGEA